MIAYFILVHRFPEQFKRLFRVIYDPKNTYLIHVDKGSGSALSKDVRKFLSKYSNAYLLPSQNIVWGGYSMVEAELRGMKKLLQLNKKWEFFINLSGQDFPLKSQEYIKNFLKKGKGKDYMLVSDQQKSRAITMNRIQNYFVETPKGFIGKPRKRKFLKGVTPYIGGQWKIFTRKACEFICTSSQVSKFVKYYTNTLIPDESFFQTVLMNTNYQNTIVNNDKRAIIWIPDMSVKLKHKVFTANETKALIASGKIKLRPKTLTVNDLPYLLKCKDLFARKFDESVDSQVLDLLELRLAPPIIIKPIKHIIPVIKTPVSLHI